MSDLSPVLTRRAASVLAAQELSRERLAGLLDAQRAALAADNLGLFADLSGEAEEVITRIEVTSREFGSLAVQLAGHRGQEAARIQRRVHRAASDLDRTCAALQQLMATASRRRRQVVEQLQIEEGLGLSPGGKNCRSATGISSRLDRSG